MGLGGDRGELATVGERDVSGLHQHRWVQDVLAQVPLNLNRDCVRPRANFILIGAVELDLSRNWVVCNTVVIAVRAGRQEAVAVVAQFDVEIFDFAEVVLPGRVPDCVCRDRVADLLLTDATRVVTCGLRSQDLGEGPICAWILVAHLVRG